jgi:hypothetical protein
MRKVILLVDVQISILYRFVASAPSRNTNTGNNKRKKRSSTTNCGIYVNLLDAFGRSPRFRKHCQAVITFVIVRVASARVSERIRQVALATIAVLRAQSFVLAIVDRRDVAPRASPILGAFASVFNPNCAHTPIQTWVREAYVAVEWLTFTIAGNIVAFVRERDSKWHIAAECALLLETVPLKRRPGSGCIKEWSIRNLHEEEI